MNSTFGEMYEKGRGASTFDWYCPHCGKRKDGGPDDYVVEHMHGMKPLVYGLCRDCAMKHHRWMEGEE